MPSLTLIEQRAREALATTEEPMELAGEVSCQDPHILQLYQQEGAKYSLASSNSLAARSGCGI
jgi:hypothetical protein